MEPIRGWGPGESAAWLRGLPSAVQQYCFEDWNLTGEDVLRLSSQDLEIVGVKSIGHQELILEAVEQLCALNYELKTDSLRSLTEKLKNVCLTLRAFILSHRKVSSYDGTAIQRPPADLLTCVIQLVSAARSLFSWLNRYLFTRLNDYSASRDVIALCAELADIIHKDTLTVSEKEESILSICQNISGVCENILSCSPEPLLSQRASLETVQLVPVPPEESLGIEITSTSFGLHFVSGTSAESPAGHSAKVLPGDEIILVNGQVVVGWSRMNLVKKLLEKSSGVTLVLKKVTLSSPDLPSSPASPLKQAFKGAFGSPAAPNSGNDESPTTGSVMACPNLVVAEFPEKVEPESAASGEALCLALQEGGRVDQQGVSSQSGASESLLLESKDVPHMGKDQPLPTPASLAHETSRPGKELETPSTTTKSQPLREDSVVNKRKQKGVATRLSRRRVSCKDLGQADFDGWLWKKKEHPGFMSQRWKRCWCHLTGNSLYWYNHPNDEKAIGFINVSTYHLESPRDPKKKYEFQLSHEKYKPFVFAADTLAEMSMWVTRLIASVTKYNTPAKAQNPKEEDCYSESEADEPEEESTIARPGSMLEELKKDALKPLTQGQHPLQRAENSDSKAKLPPKSPLATKRPVSAPLTTADPPVDDIDTLFKCLKQGGVSLIGQERLLTREQFRKSFAKRNKNPVINERVHEVRTLQSTLKAKMAELQVLEQVLNNPELTSATFKSWKKDHEELYKELQNLWVQSPGGPLDSSEESSPTHPQALESPNAAAQEPGSFFQSHSPRESLQGTSNPQEGSLPETGKPPGVKNTGSAWSPQELWSPLDMGSPLVMEKLMGSLEEIGGLEERATFFDTWSLQESASPKKTYSPDTVSLPDTGSTHIKGTAWERGSNSVRGGTQEKGCSREKGGSQKDGSAEKGSTRKKGSTRERRSTKETDRTQKSHSPGNDRQQKSRCHSDIERVGEQESPRSIEKGAHIETASVRERGSHRQSGSQREGRGSQSSPSLKKTGSPQEEGLLLKKGSSRESRNSGGRRSRREHESTQQERRKSPDSGQDGEKGEGERRLYLCI
ncbi:connector enhancer of kinase suppressor of ras 1 isoform X2 [Ambystoma mexicanum]|uniref:connector enhancer of kinase suppressor of ras 1 isoform X2 n=1 Tax=Ambystoma mexicanum TaxID=8296 RepID=UPI0037E8BBA1